LPIQEINIKLGIRLTFMQNILSGPITTTIIFVWLVILTGLYFYSQLRFTRLTQGVSKKDLRTILESLKKQNAFSQKEIKRVLKEISQINLSARSHIQRLGFMRYNPFSDTGGDQSFCLSLLDGHLNGVVISSLHSRGQTRIYAKKIKNGKCPGHTLSKEERAVIKQATKI